MTTNITVTLTGKTYDEVIAAAQTLVQSSTITTTTVAKKAIKKAAAVVDEDIELEDVEDAMLAGAEETLEDEEIGFDAEPEEKPKARKAAKITEKDLNEALKAFATANGRPKTLQVLEKKFKVKSILELKPDQYPAVLAAFKK